MARNTEGAQRTEYGNKTGEVGHGKAISSKPAEMTRGGGSGGNNSGPTGSSRDYPKGSKHSFSPDFNPIRDSNRSGTDWAVGGV